MVLKRNLPSSFSTRLNPWEEANKPATRQPEAALHWGQDDEARKPTQAARQPGQGQTMQDRLPQSLIGGGEPAQTRQQREPRNLLEAVQAAGRRRGLLPPEPEQEFDFPAIKRATGTLTSIFGRAPRDGDIIPAGSVDRYLKSLSADQFDKREDVEFFNHVRDAYRLAYPTTSYDISGRMSDSPPVAIPFMPWGEAKPRAPQAMTTRAETGMPGIIKAGMPMERPMDWKGAFEEAGKSIGHAVGVHRPSEERTDPKPQEDKGSAPPAEPTRKIDWKPAHLTIKDGTHDVFTSRAVRIDATHVSPGIDGTAYTVEWFALDANGKVQPNIRNDRPLPARGGWLLPGRTEDIIEPPFNNKHGWMARIHVPLRESNRGDASKVPLDIYTE